MVEYYGHNDWRDYHLSHHGVLGMRWGIRRYQPYGHGGYDPKGDGGREIGEARRYKKIEKKITRLSNKQAKVQAKADKYRAKSRSTLGRLTSFGDGWNKTQFRKQKKADRIGRKINRLEKKADKLKGQSYGSQDNAGSKHEPRHIGNMKSSEISKDNAIEKIAKGIVKAIKTVTYGEIKMMRNMSARHKEKVANKKEAKRQKILNTGDLETIYKNRHKFSPDELNTATNRLRAEEKLVTMRNERATRDLDQAKKVIDSIVGVSKSGLSAYNTYEDAMKTYKNYRNKDKTERINRTLRSDNKDDVLAILRDLSDDQIKKYADRQSNIRKIRNDGGNDKGGKGSKNNIDDDRIREIIDEYLRDKEE